MHISHQIISLHHMHRIRKHKKQMLKYITREYTTCKREHKYQNTQKNKYMVLYNMIYMHTYILYQINTRIIVKKYIQYTQTDTHSLAYTQHTYRYRHIYKHILCVLVRSWKLPATLKLTYKVNKFIAILYEYYIHTIHIHIYINTFDYSNGYCNHEIQVTINELMIDTENDSNKCFTRFGPDSPRTISRASTWEDRRKSRGRIANR